MKNKTVRKSILWNNLITITFPLILFGLFSTFVLYQHLRANIIEKNNIITNTLSDQFLILEEEPKRIALYISNIYGGMTKEGGESQEDDLSEKEKIEQTQDIIEQMKGIYDFILNVEIIDAEGNVILSQLNPSDVGINRSGEGFYKNLQNVTTGEYMSSPFMTTAVGVLSYTYTYKAADGYYVVIYSSLKELSDTSTLYADKFGDNVEVVIVDEYGRYVSNKDLDYVHFRMVSPDLHKIKEVALGYAQYEVTTFNEMKAVLTASSMQNNGWYIVVYQPFADVFGPLFQMLFLLSVLIVIASMVVMIYSYIYSGSINRFILNLTLSMKKASQNGYKTDLPDFNYDDLNSVANEFTSLLKAVRERDERLVSMAYKDQLTQLGNRLLLTEDISKFDHKNENNALTLVIMNIDNFKMINDVYGLEVGDRLLVYMGEELLLMNKRIPSSVYRIGPDEFALLFMETVDIKAITSLLKPFKASLMQGIYIGDRHVRISVTAGVSYYGTSTKVKKKLIPYADMALIEAKIISKGSIYVFDKYMEDKLNRQSGTEQLLRNALEEGLFELYFQPQINASTREIHGFEALIRMRKRNGELVPPGIFIPVAESTSMIIEIGEWIIREAISKTQSLNALLGTNYKVSINISTVQMKHPDFYEKAMKILEETNVSLEHIEFEITESVFINDDSEAFIAMQRFCDYGIKFALDDFGTGYSSLSYLTRLPFHTLKIDRSFIADIEMIEAKKSMLESIISMGHKLNYELIAEGIETEMQKDICVKYSCDIIQGYYYSKPLSYEQLISYCRDYSQTI